MKSRNLWIIGLVAVLAMAPAAARVEFKGVEGGEFTVPVDASTDGSIILFSGLFGAPFFYYTVDEGLVEIGGGSSGGQVRISDDGSTIVGNDLNENGIGEAAKWLGGTDWMTMGGEPGALPCGSTLSSSYDTNNTMAVGLTWRPQLCRAVGMTWDVVAGVGGPVLETQVPNRATRGNAITDDGSIIFGWQDNEFGSRQAVRWVNLVQEHIVDTDGANMGEAIGCNSDGTVYWGTSYRFAGDGRGWLYREGEGFTPMGQGQIGGLNIQSVPLSASADGSVVVGITRDFSQFIETGWIWRDKFGWQEFGDFLKGQAGKGWQNLIPTWVSADGTMIGGRGFNPDGAIQAFIVDLKAQGGINK